MIGEQKQSKCHIDAPQITVALSKTIPDVGEVLSSIHSREKSLNRKVLVRILSKHTPRDLAYWTLHHTH